MRFLKGLKIGYRLTLGFGLVILLTCVLGYKAMDNLQTLAGLMEKLYKNSMTVTNAVLEANANIIKVHRSMGEIALAKDKAEIVKTWQDAELIEKEVFKNFDLIEERFLGDKAMVQEARKAFSDWKETREEVYVLNLAGQKALATAVTKDSGAKHVKLVTEKMNGLIKFSKDEALQFLQEAVSEKDEVISLTLWLIGIIVVIASVIAYLNTISITHPLRQVSEVSSKLAEGDLKQNKLSGFFEDEVGVLRDSFNQLLDALNRFIASSEKILQGETEQKDFGLSGDFEGSLEKMLTQARDKKKRDAEMALFVPLVENMPTNLLLADSDLKLKYMNPEAKKSLEKLEQYLPIKVEDMIGQSIDIFHKDPERVRAIVSDPQNLPHEAQIQVGPETLSFMAAAIYDQNQEYIGPMVAWELITEKIANEKKVKEAAEREKVQAGELRQKVDNILAVVNVAAQGDLTQDVSVDGDDAIGQMGRGLKQFFANLRQNIIKIGENAQALGSSSEELTAVSQQMASNAGETSSQVNVVAASSDEVSKNVETVAAGTEEMSASIKEIAANATDAARVASEAVKVAETTNKTVIKLGDSSAEIGEVIKVINSIAEQTNLLALNATIEAARAGEAGKGFAVVANEVKELAKETAKATEDIGNKIQAIQEDTNSAVDAIGEISMIINQINDIASTIAGAVEEQSATVNEIGRNVNESARGTAEIAQNITGVAQTAENTASGAGDTQKAAAELSRMAADLQQLVQQFRT